MLAVVVRELSKHQRVSCLIVVFVIARFMPLSCYSSAKTRIRPVKIVSPDISVSVHQCAHFSKSPKKRHAEAAKHISRYLLATWDKRLVIQPNKDWYFDCLVDGDFARNWRQADSHINPMMSKSRSGWIIRFAGSPITWA